MSFKTHRVYFYAIDENGNLWHDNSQIDDENTLLFFMKHLTIKQNRFIVECAGEKNYLEVFDVPYVIKNLEILDDKIKLIMQGHYQEILDPSTLEIGKNHILYCQIRNKNFKAKFNRKTYYELTKLITYDQNLKNYTLNLKNKVYPLTL